MAYQVVWTGPAARDLKNAIQYIARDSQHYAGTFAREAIGAGDSLAVFPNRGRKVPELKTLPLREIFVANYRLIYQLAGHRVYVLGLVHGARNLWLAWKGSQLI